MLKSYYMRRLLSQGHFFIYSRRVKVLIKALLLCATLIYIAYSVATWNRLPSGKVSWQPHQHENYHRNRESSHLATLSDSVSGASSLEINDLVLNLKARDTDYDRCYINGRMFMCQIENYDSSSRTYPPQSQWTEPEQLKDYGWSNEPFLGDPEAVLVNLAPALAKLGLSQDLAEWEVVDDNHFPYIPPGGTATIRGTGARFAAFYNFKQGAILCQNTLAPRQSELAIRYGIPIPLLERLSDDLFINWLRLAGPAPGPVNALTFVLRFAVQNPVSMAVISAIEAKNNIHIGEWPGNNFVISEDEGGADGVALLGTPNGVAVAFLLAQHKAYFPDKTVSSVTVWTAPNPNIEDHQEIFTHMVFILGQLSPPDPEKWGCCNDDSL